MNQASDLTQIEFNDRLWLSSTEGGYSHEEKVQGETDKRGQDICS